MNQEASGPYFPSQFSIFTAGAGFSPGSLCDSRTRVTLLTLLNRIRHISEMVPYRNITVDLVSSHSHQEASRLKMLILSDVTRQVIE